MEQLSWTEDRVERLRSLAADNLSCAQIANDLGVTRNAVIGKLQRLGVSNGHRPRERNERPSKTGRLIIRPRRKKTYGGEIQVLPQLPFIDLPDESIPLEQRKTIFELDNGTCRWPCGDPGTPEFFYCGNPEANNAAGIPYCRAHTLRACAKTSAPSIAPAEAA